MSESTLTISWDNVHRWKNEDGQLHRLDGPAIEWADGSKYWYKNGECHRLDGPAIEHPNGDVVWYIDGDFLGTGLEGFWKHWANLNETQRQDVNIHIWLRKLTTN